VFQLEKLADLKHKEGKMNSITKVIAFALTLALSSGSAYGGRWVTVSDETFGTFSVYKEIQNGCHEKVLNFWSEKRESGSSTPSYMNIDFEVKCHDVIVKRVKQYCPLRDGEFDIDRLVNGEIHTESSCWARDSVSWHPVEISVNVTFRAKRGAKLQRSNTRTESLNGSTFTIEKTRHRFKQTELDGVIQVGNDEFYFDRSFPEGFIGKMRQITKERR